MREIKRLGIEASKLVMKNMEYVLEGLAKCSSMGKQGNKNEAGQDLRDNRHLDRAIMSRGRGVDLDLDIAHA